MSDDIKPEKGLRKLWATGLELGPLVLFFFVVNRWDIYYGTAVFIVATAIALPCYRWMEGRWPVMPIVGGFFVIVFGGLTLSTIGRYPKEFLFIERRATELADLAPVAQHNDTMANVDQFLGVG